MQKLTITKLNSDSHAKTTLVLKVWATKNSEHQPTGTAHTSPQGQPTGTAHRDSPHQPTETAHRDSLQKQPTPAHRDSPHQPTGKVEVRKWLT